METKRMWGKAVVAVFLMVWAVQAVPITIEISGDITSASGASLPSTIYSGVTFTGTYIYDTSTPNTSGLGGVGQYVHDSPYGINLSIGGYEFETVTTHNGQFEIGIVNSIANWDYYKVISNENESVNGTTIDYIWWTLGGPGSTISTIALPDSEPAVLVELTDWVTNSLEISGQNLFVQGTVTNVKLIPEPLTGILMVTGALYLRRRL